MNEKVIEIAKLCKESEAKKYTEVFRDHDMVRIYKNSRIHPAIQNWEDLIALELEYGAMLHYWRNDKKRTHWVTFDEVKAWVVWKDICQLRSLMICGNVYLLRKLLMKMI